MRAKEVALYHKSGGNRSGGSGRGQLKGNGIGGKRGREKRQVDPTGGGDAGQRKTEAFCERMEKDKVLSSRKEGGK